MSRRYNIGILCNELTRNFQSPLYKETKEWGRKLGVNLFFFEGRQLFPRKYSDIQHNVTYALANDQFIDGYVFHPIFNQLDHEQIVDWIKNFSDKPKVTVNKRIADLTSCVMVDNYRGIRGIMAHLTRYHGLEKIAFIMGPRNNDETRDRFHAYRDYMVSLNKWNENWVFSGGFESDSGITAIQDIISSGIEFEALVFSNDETAIAAIDYLKNVNPEYLDAVAITGFDNSPHGQLTQPALTSVSQPFSDLARTSLELIIRMLEKPDKPPIERLLPTKIAIRESCGCSTREIIDTSDLKLFTTPYNIADNIESHRREEFFDKLTCALDPSSITTCYVVIYEKQFNSSSLMKPSENSQLLYAYSNKRRLGLPEPLKFKTAELLPPQFIQGGKIENAVTQALFYRDEHFGYVVFDGTQAKEIDMDEVRSSVSGILHTVILIEELEQALNEKNSAIQQIGRLNSQLRDINSQLEDTSRKDDLTSTYNRRGFYDAVAKKLSQSDLPMPITLFYADLDDLKQVNDKHGHLVGDEFIKSSAKLLQDSFRKDDIIGRMGGDEFVVFTTGCSERDILDIVDRIHLNQRRIEIDNFSIPLQLSIGHNSIHEKSLDRVEKAMQMADKQLYQVKRERKSAG